MGCQMSDCTAPPTWPPEPALRCHLAHTREDAIHQVLGQRQDAHQSLERHHVRHRDIGIFCVRGVVAGIAIIARLAIVARLSVLGIGAARILRYEGVDIEAGLRVADAAGQHGLAR